MTQFGTEWRAAGACLSADPDLFFPVATGPIAVQQMTMARRICASCHVRQECLDFAMRSGETHGVWGGTTPDERIRARRASTQRRRRARMSPSWPGAQQIRAS